MRFRVTADQLSFLQRTAAGKPGVRMPRTKKRKEDLPENQVEKAITDWLQLHGWICTKQHAGLFARVIRGQITGYFSIGEKGQADWRAERPIIPAGQRTSMTTCFRTELFYFEIKAPGQKPKPHQTLWLDRRQLTGITAEWFDSLECFIEWYRQRYGRRGGDPPEVGGSDEPRI